MYKIQSNVQLHYSQSFAQFFASFCAASPTNSFWTQMRYNMDSSPEQNVDTMDKDPAMENQLKFRDKQVEPLLPASDHSVRSDNSSATKRAKVDFSIDAILSRTQSTSSAQLLQPQPGQNPNDEPQFSWVYCTRYRPPKLPRKSITSLTLFSFFFFLFLVKNVPGSVSERHI